MIIKLYRAIGERKDCCLLQADLDSLGKWSDENRLPFNMGKCEQITLTRKTRNAIEYTYSIGGEVQTRVDRVKDLGILIDQRVTFIPQINAVRRKAKRLVAFLNRNTGNFRDQGVLKTLYFSIVRSVLECGLLIWYTNAQNRIRALKRIQERFGQNIYSKIFQYYPIEIEYDELLRGFEISSLGVRNRVAVLLFLYNLINGRLHDSELLFGLNVHVPAFGGRFQITLYSRLNK